MGFDDFVSWRVLEHDFSCIPELVTNHPVRQLYNLIFFYQFDKLEVAVFQSWHKKMFSSAIHYS